MPSTRILILSTLGIFALWLVLPLGAYMFLGTWAERGQFGDLFGVSNSLFSGLAFTGLILTILLQRHQLSLQMEELRLQRTEMAQTRAVLAEQAKSQEYQFRAAVAAIRVSSSEARIEAKKMESEQFTPGARNRFAIEIDGLSDQIEVIANELAAESG